MRLAGKLLKLSDDQKQSLLSTAFWSDKLMNWAMQDEAFKVQLFRFVDTFPMLKTPDQVHDHLTDYLSQPGVTRCHRAWASDLKVAVSLKDK